MRSKPATLCGSSGLSWTAACKQAEESCHSLGTHCMQLGTTAQKHCGTCLWTVFHSSTQQPRMLALTLESRGMFRQHGLLLL